MTDDQKKAIERVADQYKGTPKGALETMLHTGAQTFENLSGLRVAIQRIEDAERAEDLSQRERHHGQLTWWAKVAAWAAWVAALGAAIAALYAGLSFHHPAIPHTGSSPTPQPIAIPAPKNTVPLSSGSSAQPPPPPKP